MEMLGLAAVSAAALALGVLHIVIDTPLFASAEDGSLEGDLVPNDQDDPDPSENQSSEEPGFGS